jgi:hypothetical protein
VTHVGHSPKPPSILVELLYSHHVSNFSLRLFEKWELLLLDIFPHRTPLDDRPPGDIQKGRQCEL